MSYNCSATMRHISEFHWFIYVPSAPLCVRFDMPIKLSLKCYRCYVQSVVNQLAVWCNCRRYSADDATSSVDPISSYNCYLLTRNFRHTKVYYTLQSVNIKQTKILYIVKHFIDTSKWIVVYISAHIRLFSALKLFLVKCSYTYSFIDIRDQRLFDGKKLISIRLTVTCYLNRTSKDINLRGKQCSSHLIWKGHPHTHTTSAGRPFTLNQGLFLHFG